MAMPSKYFKLLTQTGAANTAFTTAVFDTSLFDSVAYFVTLSGGVAPASLTHTMYAIDADGSTVLGFISSTIATGAGIYAAGWGPGCSGAYGIGAGFAGTLPTSMKMLVPAFGVGITATLVVIGRRSHRGPDVSSNPD